ncbi:MAG: bifunctional pyr operon transcriptional regulator/uracil phosphoribosyltransferase PyrR [Bacteroidota bacterium]|mgnify:CR=1 FL=1|nr:bifunctional pyr operon transcriptional regulator/uracil phosphoribosyltransferase PyrR [Bacteroidota bacterium]MDX5429404.1 bifunctional pyr operon transcriptional regulator/uracil phosphoribosyltransferase PyrR [Bacteroidota bacterium]MDX5468195.1 bifunctional pyr operon transcriptional regulator/uracil phosphoribosyltransferase PyrR [Bacteroidota bacterium]
MEPKILINEDRMAVMIRRMAYELYENYTDFSDTAIIGLQPRGAIFAKRLHGMLQEISGTSGILFGELDVTFHRDDFRRGSEPLTPSVNSMNFIIENKRVILIDDVLYTGRSVRAAMDALTSYGRPSRVELAVLIDRRYSRELPIEPNYIGEAVDTRANDKVKVQWKEKNEKDCVWLLTAEETK